MNSPRGGGVASLKHRVRRSRAPRRGFSSPVGFYFFQILPAVHPVRVLLLHLDGVLRAAPRAAAHRAQAAHHQLHVHVDHGGHHADGLHGQRVDVVRRRRVRRDDDRLHDRPRPTASGHRGDGRERHRRPVQRHRRESAVDLRRWRRRRHGEFTRQEFELGPGQTQEHVESGQPHVQDQLQQGQPPRRNENDTDTSVLIITSLRYISRCIRINDVDNRDDPVRFKR